MSIARYLSKLGRMLNSSGLILPEALANGGAEFGSNNVLIKGGSNTNNPNFVFGGVNQCGWYAPNNGWMSFTWMANSEL